MFKDKTIRTRVMKVVEAHIESKQKQYDTEVEKIEAEHEEAVKALEEKKEANKVELADKLVAEIVGSIIPNSNVI